MNQTSNTNDQIEEHAHRSPSQYVFIAVILSALTGMEVFLYYIESSLARGLLIFALLSLAAIKFFLVAAFFMHLKDDPKIFRRWFAIWGVGALIVFIIVLTSLSIQDQRFF